LGFTEKENSTSMGEDKYNIVAKYGYEGYPANPNGSDFNTAMLCDYRSSFSDDAQNVLHFNGTGRTIQRIEMMKFLLGMKPL
jgi:hypothetical protein